MTNYEFDKNTGEVRFDGRLVAKIEMKDSRVSSDFEDIFNFWKENCGVDFEELRNLIDQGTELYKKISEHEKENENIDVESELFYDVRDFVEGVSNLEVW